jgi:glycosyltransferase involved in cell wall biosynthesis
MRVLVVTPYPLFPLSHGGRVRSFRLATGLAQAGATVDVLFPWTPGQPLGATRRDGVTLHPHRFAANVLPALFRDRLVPSPVALAAQPYALGPRRRLRGFDGYDVVQFEFCATARWMGRAPAGARVVYSAHNVEADFWSHAQLRRGPRRAMCRAVAALERRAVGVSDMVLVPTQADADRLTELYGPARRIAVLPQGYDGEVAPAPERRTRMRECERARLGLGPGDVAVVFVGGPAAHNREAVAFLERELVPRLGRRGHVLIAGKCGGRGGGQTRRLGFVEDLGPLLAAADVAVNPVATGTGQSLKVAEYLAAGVPVVATPAGARGIDPRNGLLTVTERPGFAQAVVAASGRRRGQGANGTAAASWRQIGARLHAELAELVH